MTVGAQLLAAPAGAIPLRPAALRRVIQARKSAITGKQSPNGWPINTGANTNGSVWARPLAGTGFTIDTAIGDVETILVHVVRRFHYEIKTLSPGDVVGFKEAPNLHRYELNHASGTAIDILPGHYPVGVRGGYFPQELEIIRDILADCEGVVRWGGDFSKPDEAHFEIDLPPTDAMVSAIATKLRGWNFSPGQGAGIIQNPNDQHRRATANRLERRQKG